MVHARTPKCARGEHERERDRRRGNGKRYEPFTEKAKSSEASRPERRGKEKRTPERSGGWERERDLRANKPYLKREAGRRGEGS